MDKHLDFYQVDAILQVLDKESLQEKTSIMEHLAEGEKGAVFYENRTSN
ncbi:MAG: hypothetical protein FWH57_05605 [Oscillospiraceae bacterium]|nr:hypothetical protein [Oscillospiraceae bacterium]